MMAAWLLTAAVSMRCWSVGFVQFPATGALYHVSECSDGTLVFEPTDCRDPDLPSHLSCKES